MNTKLTYALALALVLLVAYMGRCEKYEEDDEKKFKQNPDGTFYSKLTWYKIKINIFLN